MEHCMSADIVDLGEWCHRSQILREREVNLALMCMIPLYHPILSIVVRLDLDIKCLIPNVGIVRKFKHYKMYAVQLIT